MNLDKRAIEYVLKEVEVTMARLGVYTKFEYFMTKDYRGDDVLKAKSEPFRITPMVFKEIWIEGTFFALNNEEGEFELGINLGYHWKSFRGGSNGTELGTICYKVDMDMPLPKKIEDFHYCFLKVKSIEI